MSQSPSPPVPTVRPSVSPPPRIQALDALRGYALCGIIFINIPQTLDMFGAMSQPPDGMRWFMVGRFYPTFALLFGVGCGIFLRAAAGRADSPRVLLVRRFLALAVFGWLHQLLQPGEVLLPYAIVGLVVLLPLSFLPPLEGLIAGWLLTLVGLLAGFGGYALFPGLFVLGFVLAELRIPETLARRTRQLLLVTLGCAVVALLLFRLITLRPSGAAEAWLDLALSTTMAMGYAALFLALLRTPVGHVVSTALEPMGRLALTNYLTATVLFLPIGTALELQGSARWAEATLLGAGILVVQMIWSALWLRAFRYGPLEWLWRCATYWRLLPLRREAPAPQAG